MPRLRASIFDRMSKVSPSELDAPPLADAPPPADALAEADVVVCAACGGNKDQTSERVIINAI